MGRDNRHSNGHPQRNAFMLTVACSVTLVAMGVVLLYMYSQLQAQMNGMPTENAGNWNESFTELVDELNQSKKFIADLKVQLTNLTANHKDELDQSNKMIAKLEAELTNHKDTLVDMQSRITKLEDRTAVYELRLTPKKGNFNETREMCRQMGGDLMQNTLLTNTYGGNYLDKFRNISAGVVGDVFIGITDLEVEGNWKFLNGEDYIPANSISNWRSSGEWGFDFNEPSGGRSENCAAAIPTAIPPGSGPLLLNDQPCTGFLFHGVCEIRM